MSHLHSSYCNSLAVITDHLCLQPQDESLAAVQSILGCSRDTARKLLTHFQWNKEALFGTVCAHQLFASSVSSCTFLTSLCAGTLADRSEEAVYQSAGVTSRSDVEAPDGKAFDSLTKASSLARLASTYLTFVAGHFMSDLCGFVRPS